MGVIESFVDKKMVRHKMMRLMDIAVEESSELLSEAISLHPLFGEADVTIYNFRKAELMASTVCNVDILDAVRAELGCVVDYEEIEGYVIYDKKKLRRLRSGVTHMGVVSLFTAKARDIVLIIEYYSKYDGLSLDKLGELFKLLTLVVRNAYLSGVGETALRIDGSTMLPNRDALVERLNNATKMGIKRCCLGVVAITNAPDITDKRGGAETDRLLRAVGVELGRLMPGGVYRIGGSKFGVVISGDVFYARPILEGLVDRILLLDEDIITSNVLCPLLDDSYTTIAVCEKNLKFTDEDVVTIVRGGTDSSFEAEYKDVCDVFFDVEYTAAQNDGCSSEDEPMYQSTSEEVVDTPTEGSSVSDVDVAEFVMNDVFDFEGWPNDE